MAIVIVVFGDAVGNLAMPALAGLLILIGVRTVKPADLQSVWRTGIVQKAVLVVTFVLTMLIPLQYAVMVGVGLSVVLHVVQQSNRVTIVRRIRDGAGERDRDRSARRASALGGRRAAAVRQPLLRVGARSSRHSFLRSGRPRPGRS